MTLPRRPNEALRHVMAACYRLAPGGTVVSRVLVHVRKAPQTRRSRCRSDVGLRKFRRVRKNYPRTLHRIRSADEAHLGSKRNELSRNAP